MENFILYEELGSGRNSVVYKGRRKGNLNYVAIICVNKTKRPEITNHVRLSRDIDHPNIAYFYEWYETSSHIWLVVELCTGGSLESVIGHDGCLPEHVVRKFGWDLVQGLKHIHELGIIFCDLTPAKILLDGSGILKFGNFCLSKAEGETLEDLFLVLSPSNDAVEGDAKLNFDVIKKRLQGSLAYCAPEVLEGCETNMRSDLWALGCVLYYMYTGKPPFYSDIQTELTDMILHHEVPPPTQTVSSVRPPSSDFQSLLNGLLSKEPDKRMDWPELLDHPFWKQEEDIVVEGETEDDEGCNVKQKVCEGVNSVCLRNTWTHNISPPGLTDKLLTNRSVPSQLIPSHQTTDRLFDRSTDRQQSVKHVSCRPLKYDQGLDKEPGKERRREELEETEDDLKLSGTKQTCSVQISKSFTPLSQLKPKSGVDEDNTEAIFLLSSCANSRKNGSISYSANQNFPPQDADGTDVTHSVKALLHTDADMTVTPIIDNPKILKGCPLRFDPRTLCVPAYSAEKLLSLSDEEWPALVLQLCSCFEEPSRATSPSSSSASTAVRSRLNLLCYLCCVVGHEDIANRLTNSSLLQVLTQQLRQAPNWDVRTKVLRVMGLLALHCSDLRDDSPVSEAVSTLTDLLRENLRNSKIKQFLLPPLGEFLYLISSQEEKRGSPEGLWFVPAAAYTGLMRSLREGDDPIVHHMAAKAIENIATTVSDSSHKLLTTSDVGSALWYLFTHSTVEAVRVTAISALSRLTRVVPAVFLTVIDTCGPAAVIEAIGGAGARVQQHLLTAVATALLTSRVQTHRITQSKELVLKVLRFLESPSTVTRAKALLLLLLLIQDNTQTLLHCCQQRLVMYLERDVRKATPLRENPSQSAYLSQCLKLAVTYLSGIAPVIMEDTLCALRGVTGRKHPSTAQSRQLKQTLPTISVVLGLCSSQVFRCQIVSEDFLTQTGSLLDCIASVESNETNLASAVGVATCEEFTRSTLSIAEILSQHHALITPYSHVVVDAVLPPLTSLVFSRNVEWTVFALRVLSEISLVLLVQDDGGFQDSEERTVEQKDKDGRMSKRREDGSSCSQMISFITESLFPRYEALLRAAEPIPLYALKLLVSMTEHSIDICRLIQHSKILPGVFQIILANSSIVTSGLVQTAVVLLCNLCGDTVLDHQPLYQQGLIEMVVSTLSKAAQAHLDADGPAGRKSCHLVLQALLELLHNILKQTSVVVRSALQSQRLSRPAVETEAAEKLLLTYRPLSQLSSHLIHMLSSENQEVWEESLQCLSLLVQLYGGEGDDCLSPSCLQSFSHILRTKMCAEITRVPWTTLRIIKRLVQTSDRSDWFECPEGMELISLLQNVTTSKRCHADMASLAAEILKEISAP
ncbi:serine/threonine-protein kinase ULK4 [Salarias fasciatus]|nr:serine/threonine-protein kinase ULK4 [Salarias fasciatus]